MWFDEYEHEVWTALVEAGRIPRVDANGFQWFVTAAVWGRGLLDKVRAWLGLETSLPSISRAGSNVAAHVAHETRKVLGTRADRMLSQAPTVDQWRRENVALVRRMANEELVKLEQILRDMGTARVEDVSAAIAKQLGVSRQRADLIAVDQVLKLNAQLTREAHQQCGIDEYYWADVEDESVRHRHKELGDESREGKRFRYDDPPVNDDQGGRGNPGEAVHCRCQAIPYVPELAQFE